MQDREKSKEKLIGAIERLEVHNHVCLIYETQNEKFDTVIPFMQAGLERKERCVYIADEDTAKVVTTAMHFHGISVDSALASGALAVATKQEAYLKQGYFDPDWMIHFLKESTDSAKNDSFSALRVTGEMTWALGGDPGTDRLIEYESKLNYFFPKNDALAICQYNNRRFKPEIITDVILAHPIVIFGGLICKNPYYVPPERFFIQNKPQLRVEELLEKITAGTHVQ